MRDKKLGEQEKGLAGAQLRRIASVLAHWPAGEYDSVMKWYDEAQAALESFFLSVIEPAFNHRLASLAQETIAEKQALCRWANAELRANGLAIRCAKTGLPAILHLDVGANARQGRFQIELIGRGGRKRTTSMKELGQLRLCVERSRDEPLANYWTEVIRSRPPVTPKRTQR